jgi:LDH2 family malate/lactate/ureidoglycolate dehydrogenase
MSEQNTATIVRAEVLSAFCADVLRRGGMDPAEADLVAHSLVEADLRGIYSHGVVRLWLYERRLRAGLIRSTAPMRFTRTGPATAILAGGHGAGQVIGMRAMTEAIALARDAGVGCVAVTESNHFGIAAYFTMQALQHDMIGFAACHTDSLVAPYGAATPFFGTNPLSIAIPAGEEDPFVLDMATSVAPVGKITSAKAAGKPIPEGWAVDAAGNPTTDPAAALEGSLLPVGTYKGYGLSMAVEVFSALLGGSPFGPHVPIPFTISDIQNLGQFFGALDLRRFGDPAAFKARMDQMIRQVKGLSRAPGFEEILVAGEPEARCRRERLRQGIPLTDEAVRVLSEYGFPHSGGGLEPEAQDVCRPGKDG